MNFKTYYTHLDDYIIKPTANTINTINTINSNIFTTQNTGNANPSGELQEQLQDESSYVSFSNKAPSIVPSIEPPSIENDSYFEHFKSNMIISGVLFKQSFYYFVNGIFPTVFISKISPTNSV